MTDGPLTFSRGGKIPGQKTAEETTAPLSLTQTRLNTIANYPKPDPIFYTTYVKWYNRLSDSETYTPEVLQERLAEIAQERPPLTKLVLYPPATLPGPEWKTAWTRLQRLEAQARAIEETMVRRAPRRRTQGTSTSRPAGATCAPSSTLPISTEGKGQDPFEGC